MCTCRVLRMYCPVRGLVVLWMIRLRFVLKNRCVQSLAAVPPIFGMVTLACTRDGSLVRSRGSIEQKEFGKLKLLPGFATLYRMEEVGECCQLPCPLHLTSGQ